MKRHLSILAITLALLVFAGCSNMVSPPDTGSPDNGSVHLNPSDPIQSYKIVESGPIMLDNLTANQVFAVAVNKAASLVNYSYAGGVASYTLNGIKHPVALSGRSANRTLFDTSDRNAPLV
jgi:PBP1b-binding outer membrane lipoprotein LpoB